MCLVNLIYIYSSKGNQMDKTKVLTIEELTAWRSFDALRRSWEMREEVPHEGFTGTRYNNTCPCFSCAEHLNTSDYITLHNSRIEKPEKEIFYANWEKTHGSLAGCEWNWNSAWKPRRVEQEQQSFARAKILNEFIGSLKKDKTMWYEALILHLNKLTDKKTTIEKIFLMTLIQTMITLLNERTVREKEKTEVAELTSIGFTYSLRAYNPPINRTRHKRDWTK